MASLRKIMNVDVEDDHHNTRSLMDTGSTPSQLHDSKMVSGAYVSGPEYSMNTSPSGKIAASPSSRSSHSLPADQHTSPMPYNHSPHRCVSGRRQSNTSTESTESQFGRGHSYGHGHTASFSSAPLRPGMSPQDAPVKLTPITGRVSRAKKGVPVHTCDICRPPKTFTRAEHLRRHQLSHQPPDLPCPRPGCDKVFHRRDLLERHQQRHEQDDRVGQSNADTQSRSPYNPGGRRRPSYSSSPPGSLISMQRSYGNASPAVSASSISMTPGHWATHKSTPVPMHQASDLTMEGMKNEYLLDAVSNVQITTATTTPEYSQPRSMPGIPAVDPVHDICPSAAAPVSTMAWPAVTALPTTTQAAFTSVPLISATDRRSVLPLPHTNWAPTEQSISRGMPNSVLAANSGFHVPYAYTTSLPQSYAAIYDEEPSISILDFNGNSALYGAPIPTPPTRSLSSQLVLGQSSETMVTVPAPLPADRVVNPIAYRAETSPRLSLLPHDFLPVSLSREARSALPTYIDIYWDKVHPLYPIIHRATMENVSDNVSEEEDILRCAMAAFATQFLGHREHRINGSQLHAYAWQKSKAFTQSAQWSLPVMQCTLLCEYYARFRGRHKDDYQPSTRFLTLYQLVLGFRNAPVTEFAGNNSQRWAAWIYLESCRRLLSACFLLSVHGMCYHEQPYSTVVWLETISASTFHIPLSGSTTILWEAKNAEAWAAIDMSSFKLTTIGDVMRDESSSSIENPPFDVSLLIAAHALRLPTRQNRQEVELVQHVSGFRKKDLPMFKYFSCRPGATTYLALHYTPLHVLLAVSGDSWVFNKKIPDASLFAEHKRKLRLWRNSGTSAIAAVFAASAIRDFLGLSKARGQIIPAITSHGVVACKEISDYWGIYVCTLICWAFGYVGKRMTSEKRLPAQIRAVNWIQTAADMEPAELQASSGREDSQAIVGFVRDILEKDCLAGRNILFVDSIGVLRKLEEVDSWTWF